MCLKIMQGPKVVDLKSGVVSRESYLYMTVVINLWAVDSFFPRGLFQVVCRHIQSDSEVG
jgi:hypothetical protein